MKFLQKNMSQGDRTARGILGIILLVAVLLPPSLAVPWNYVVAVVAVILLVTALAGTCPVYSLLGWSTAKRPTPAPRPAKGKAKARKKRR